MRNYTPIIITLITLLIITGAGFFLYQKYQKPTQLLPISPTLQDQKQNQTFPTSTPVISTTISTTTPENKNTSTSTDTISHPRMKLYRNEQWGFEFQYPASLTLREEKFPPYTFRKTGDDCLDLLQEENRPNRSEYDIRLIDPKTKFKIAVFEVSLSGNTERLSLGDWLSFGERFLEKHREECQYHDENIIAGWHAGTKRIVVDGISGTEAYRTCCMEFDRAIFFQKEDKVYGLIFPGDIKFSPEEECGTGGSFANDLNTCIYIGTEGYDAILSSFKFLK